MATKRQPKRPDGIVRPDSMRGRRKKSHRPDRPGVAAQPNAAPEVVPLAYAGRWVAWDASGRRIVADGESYDACVLAASAAGFPEDSVAVECVPAGRHRSVEPYE